MQEFNAEFEKYIIFHRGIAEIAYKTKYQIDPATQEYALDEDGNLIPTEGDGHLHVIYQDGYDQDLGDPFGARAEYEANKAQSIVNEALTQLETMEEYASEITELKNAIQRLTEQANQASTDAVQAAEKAENLVNIQGIEGEVVIDQDGIHITSDNRYVDFGSVDGIEEAEVQEGPREFYVDFSKVNGIEKNNENYAVDFNTPISQIGGAIKANVDFRYKGEDNITITETKNVYVPKVAFHRVELYDTGNTDEYGNPAKRENELVLDYNDIYNSAISGAQTLVNNIPGIRITDEGAWVLDPQTDWRMTEEDINNIIGWTEST